MIEWHPIGDESGLPKDGPFIIYQSDDSGWTIDTGEWCERDQVFFSYGCGWDSFTHWAKVNHPR